MIFPQLKSCSTLTALNARYTDASVVWILISVHIGDLVKTVFGFVLVKKGIWARNIVAQ